MMNAKAKEVGARDSHWTNPHGLHDPQHYTTAYDLAQIARAAMRYPFFNQMVKTRETNIHGNWKIGPVRVLENKNHLLWQWNESDGVKTGYTRQAGRCLIASATRQMRGKDGVVRPWRLVSVVLYSPDTFGESANLLLNAFNHFQPTPIVQKGEGFAPVDVRGGAARVHPVAQRSVKVPLRKGETLTRKFHYTALKAPLRRGQRVGELELWSGSGPVARVPLVAREDVSISLMARVAPDAPLSLFNNTFFLAAAGAAALSLLLLLLRRAHKPLRSHHV
jgi:D-alanyl-D-alanine carboxypeptidase (penicillin-binding protein 5/6)